MNIRLTCSFVTGIMGMTVSVDSQYDVAVRLAYVHVLCMEQKR